MIMGGHGVDKNNPGQLEGGGLTNPEGIKPQAGRGNVEWTGTRAQWLLHGIRWTY